MRIGDVARRSGVSARMLRHYDSLGLVSPHGRSSAGYREYLPADLTRIFHVESLRSLGLSLREVGHALDDPDFAPDALVAELAERTRERIAESEQLLGRLTSIQESGAADWDNVLETVALLAALASPDAGRRQRAALAVDDAAAPTSALVHSLLHEPDPNVAGALRWALVRSGEGAVPALAEAARSGDVEQRRRAVLALMDIAGPQSQAALLASVSDADPEVRARAALELSGRGVEVPAEVFIGLIVEGIRDVDAADALASMATARPRSGGGDAAEQIAQALAATLQTASPDARSRIAQALGDIPGDTAAAVLGELTADHDEKVSWTASYLLSGR